MKKIFKWFFAIIFIVSMGFGSLTASAETTYTEFNKTISQLDKSWTIQFSQEVGSSVDEINNNIRLVSSSGENFPIDEMKTKVENSKVTVYPKQNYVIGETYTLYVESGITSKTGLALKPPAKLTFHVEAPSTEMGNKVYDKSGTYQDGTIKGSATVNAANVTLNNMVIEGDLIIAESVGEGEVYFNNVTVKGETRILGGGKNSVYFENSILATVIVNKNTGAVRVVVKGDTSVQEVFLESSAILQEEVTTGAGGFTNVKLQESMRNSDNNVELIGTFETINVYAADVQVTLPKNSTVNDLILAAVATVKGQGIITKLEVGQSANGSQLETTPHSAVLTIGTHITVGQGDNQTTIQESYTKEQTTSIKSIEVTPTFITVHLEQPLYNLSLQDFSVKVLNSNGKNVALSGLTYDANSQMLFFEPIPYSDQYDNDYTIQVGPSTSSDKLTGKPVTTDLLNELGFSGKITDIYGNAVANASILVDTEYGEQYRAATNAYGYYFVYTYSAGDFRGSIQAPGYYKGSIIAVVTNNKIATGVNETIMRAASSKEWKIMVTWNGLESDIDSHLANDYFHVYYANREYIGENGIQYVDLDWDDTQYYGPETTTIRQFQDGRYIFFLHNFSGQNELNISDSKIQVFKGNSTEADYTFTVPQNTQNARYWGAFELYVSNNGQTVELVPVNILTNSEDVLIQPKNTLQNLLETLHDGTDYVIVDEISYAAAFQTAQRVLNNPSASFEQIVDAYNHLKKYVKTFISQESNYLRVQYLNDENINYLQTPIHEPVSFTFETKPYEYADVINNPWSTFRPGDRLQMRLSLSAYSDDMFLDVSNQVITLQNTVTGEIITKTTDANGVIDIGTFTTEELLQLPKYKIETSLTKSGSYSVGIFLKSEKEYEIYDGYDYYPMYVEDYNYIDVFVTE